MSNNVTSFPMTSPNEEEQIRSLLLNFIANRHAIPCLAEIIIGDSEDLGFRYHKGHEIHEFFNDAGLECEPMNSEDHWSRKAFAVHELQRISEDPIQMKRVIIHLADPTQSIGMPEYVSIVRQKLNDLLVSFDLKVSIVRNKPVLTLSNHIWDEDVPSSALPDIEVFRGDGLISDPEMLALVNTRFAQAATCRRHGATLAAVIMLGSAIEGVLWSFADSRKKTIYTFPLRPREQDGSNKHLNEWTLEQLIAVAHNSNWIKRDVRDFSNLLRDFRNLVHPLKQKEGNYGDVSEHTASVCWSVVGAALAQLRDFEAKEIKLLPQPNPVL